MRNTQLNKMAAGYMAWSGLEFLLYIRSPLF